MRNVSIFAVALFACSSKPEPVAHPVAPPPPAAGSNTGVSRVVDATPDVPLGKREVRDDELAAAATKILNAFANSEPALTRDGKRVLFVSNRDGLPQLYLADATKPESPATRVFSTTERVGGAVITKDGSSIVFVSDTGANEEWSIFKVGMDGTGLIELTPNKQLQRGNLVIPDGKADTAFYTGRAKSDAGTTVYSTPIKGPSGETAVFKDDKPGFLADVSRDGKSALYVRVASHDDNVLELVDLVAHTAKRIYPATGKVSIKSAAFSADGKRAVVATDGGAEQALVLAYDLGTMKQAARYVETKPATASIDGIVVAKTGNLIAFMVDAGNHSELRLVDAKTLTAKAAIAMPLGLGWPNAFSEDGKRLTATWSTPAEPQDIYSIDTVTGAATPLRKDIRPGFESLSSVEASIVQIDAFDHGKIPVNVYQPAKRDTKLPVIVSFHGGPASSSSIRWSAYARFFLEQGYAWVEPNVRGSTGFGRAYEAADNGPKRLDAFKDIETVGTWVGAQPWADNRRIVIFGGSYGGYSVLVGLTRTPDLWRAGVDISGITNLKTFMATTTGVIHELFKVEFGDPDKDGAFLDSISPITAVNSIKSPLFVFAGANDPRVPRAEADQIVVALRTRGIPVEYMVKDDEGHGISRQANNIEFLSRSARFLEAHLK
jgi:dipeptidyl aminopeptidase/acylaminoacyl peptidase